MCFGCGGTCSQLPDDAPRFVRPVTGTRPVVVGSAYGPDQVPTALVTPRGNLLTFETLYAGLGPGGEPAALTYPGTYGAAATRAGKGR